MRAVSTARRETSTAVTLPAPRCAAQTARTPLPVHRSSTDAPNHSACSDMARASNHVSEIGRKTPGSVAIRMIGHISALAMPANTGIDDVRAAFEIARPMTVGLEEELMVLDPG